MKQHLQAQVDGGRASGWGRGGHHPLPSPHHCLPPFPPFLPAPPHPLQAKEREEAMQRAKESSKREKVLAHEVERLRVSQGGKGGRGREGGG